MPVFFGSSTTFSQRVSVRRLLLLHQVVDRPTKPFSKGSQKNKKTKSARKSTIVACALSQNEVHFVVVVVVVVVTQQSDTKPKKAENTTRWRKEERE